MGVVSVVVLSFAGSVCAATPNDAPAATRSGDIDSKIPKEIETHDVFWGGKHGELHHGLRFFQDGRLLEGADQYRAIDRPDLAKLYLQRTNQASMQGALGGVLVVGGLVAMIGGAAADRCSRDYGCESHSATGVIVAGLLGAVIGGVVAAAGPNPRPISDEELRRLVDSHNGAVQRRASAPSGPKVTGAPYIGPGGQPGLALAAAF